MGLCQYAQSVDGTIPVQALLYSDEELLASQDSIGIYDGLQKSPHHQQGTVHATTHRLFYVDTPHPLNNSFALDLSRITKTEYYAGLFKSSPKVTLHLSGSSSGPAHGSRNDPETSFEAWECEVCAYRNPPGLSPAASRICGLCGVPRASVPQSSGGTVHNLSKSLPSSPPSSRPLSAGSNSTPNTIACPACTFLNHPDLPACEICGTELPRKITSHRSAPSSPPVSDSDDEDFGGPQIMKLSFRKGGDKPFYAILKRALQGKAWEIASTNRTQDPASASGRDTPGRSGISGILRTVEATAQQRQTGMTDALQDLEALMVKARGMVKLAAELNEKLTALTAKETTPSLYSSSSTTLVNEPEEATFIRSSLSQLGLQMSNAPLTQDMVSDERRWHEELARELGRVLQGSSDQDAGLMKTRGVIALDEVWGGWNRARGVALIPPSTLLQVLPHLPHCTSPSISHRAFSSGLSVLHTPSYSHAQFSTRLCSILAMSGPKTTMEIAMEEGITIGLTWEMVWAVENDGDICRDDNDAAIVGGASGSGAGNAGGGEVRWWGNVFVGYVWDGQEDGSGEG
ncbi:hypothetical protein AX16_007682 [Volvariella volvacea WC 439]|nr:hypothetical protein AX16_007682 [Volvariella volvacea WC 439]